MSPKKSTRSQAAQQLIENLLDELPSSGKAASNAVASGTAASAGLASKHEVELSLGDGTGSFGPVDEESDHNIVIDGIENVSENQSLFLEKSEPAAASRTEKPKTPPPFEGESPVVTQLVRREKIVKPPAAAIVREESKRPEADIDFGQMTADDPFDAPAPADDASEETFLKKAESTPAPVVEDERTVRVPSISTLVSPPEPRSEVIQGDFNKPRSIDRGGATEIRSGVKIPPSPRYAGHSGGAPTSIEAALKQSESLRIAQDRILELDRELERLRRDNEDLSTAGDTLRRRTDELMSRAEHLEIQAREAGIRLEEEKKVLRGQIQQKERDNQEMRSRVDEIETRLESNFKKIRVRERELEHRLEIVKMENATLISTKDKMLLDLKRQIDQLHHESDSAKSKSQELFSQYKDKQETIRRVVRALRIALTILEGDDEAIAPIKKAE